MSSQPHSGAIIDTLTDATLTVGDHEAISENGRVIAPQVVLYLLPGGARDGVAADPDGFVLWRFQLTGVGRIAGEARDQIDAATAALTATRIQVDGFAPQRVEPVGAVGVLRDDTLTPPLFAATQVYGMWSFPDPAGS